MCDASAKRGADSEARDCVRFAGGAEALERQAGGGWGLGLPRSAGGGGK